MPSLARHLILLGLAVPAGILSYHFVSQRAVADGGELVSASDLVGVVEDFAMGSDRPRRRSLGYLDLLDRDLFLVNERYVQPERIDPEAMFDGALDNLERSLASVLFVKEPSGRRLQVTVGHHTETLLLQPRETVDDVAEQLREVAAILDEHLPPEVDRADVEYRMINGVLGTLDPHTILMPPDDAADMDVDNEGEFGGLGIEIAMQDGRLIIKQPLEDTPASREGLKAEDVIVRIEDVSTINMDLSEAVSLLRGKVGTEVTIRVDRKGFDEPQPFTLTRARIPLNRAEGFLLEGDVGYVRIKSFNAHVSSDLDDILSRFRRDAAGAELAGLIIDLRSNPGGYLHQAVEVVDRFVADGEIVTTVEGGQHPRRETESARAAGTEPDYPVAVLVNGSSASASEIVAGALRNRKRAVIIGERTFGKGSVQHLFRHADESKLKLTVAQYLTPGDKSIQSVGIPPDIELLPSLVEVGEEDAEDVVSLYWRDRVDREADLDQHLVWSPSSLEQPVYRLRYLLDREEGEEPHQSWEVDFAREVLLAAPGARRAEVLQAAADVVQRRDEAEHDRIAAAFAELDIDWSEGEQPAVLALDAALDLGEAGVLRSGERHELALVVTNRGEDPVHQLSAVLDSSHPALDGREFYFGRLEPGETRRYAHEVTLPTGYGSELAPVEVVYRDPDRVLGREALRVESRAVELPRLGYTLELDDSRGGDADGMPEVGETLDLVVTVTNTGTGPTQEAYVRLKNRSGRSVDLIDGRLDVGELRTEDGAACADPDTEGCARHLEPGESFTGRLAFELRSLPAGEEWELEVQLGDNSAYDYATVVSGGFRDWFQAVETVSFEPDAAPVRIERTPPSLELTRSPGLLTNLDEAVISGVVEDEAGVQEVMIFLGEDKVFYRGGSTADQTLPFTVELPLAEGPNRITVLTRNVDGLTNTQSLHTWREAPTAQASEGHGPGPG